MESSKHWKKTRRITLSIRDRRFVCELLWHLATTHVFRVNQNKNNHTHHAWRTVVPSLLIKPGWSSAIRRVVIPSSKMIYPVSSYSFLRSADRNVCFGGGGCRWTDTSIAPLCQYTGPRYRMTNRKKGYVSGVRVKKTRRWKQSR